MSAECDFCHAKDPEWAYPCAEFSVPHLGWGSRGAWAACETCSQLIESDETVKLVERAIATSGQIEAFETTFGPMTKAERLNVFIETSSLHRRFRLNRRGPRIPFG